MSLWALVMLLGGALSIAEVAVLIKKFPPVDPLVENGLGMAIGGAALLVLSLAVGEPRVLPVTTAGQAALFYQVLFGSIGMFLLYLIVLHRWSASATSYIMLLLPLVAVALGALVLGEQVTGVFLAGGALVIAGVYIGAFATRERSVPSGNR